jgi:hypothetical protein
VLLESPFGEQAFNLVSVVVAFEIGGRSCATTLEACCAIPAQVRAVNLRHATRRAIPGSRPFRAGDVRGPEVSLELLESELHPKFHLGLASDAGISITHTIR